MIKNFVVVTLFVFLLLFTGCKKAESRLQILATVGSKKIYINEFRDRLNYIPDIKFISIQKIKLWGLNSLIAEKLLSIRAAKIVNLNLQLLLDQQNRESMIEVFWKNVIFSKIKTSDSLLWNYYVENNRTRIVKFIIVTDSLLAQKIFLLWSDDDKKINQQALMDTINFRSTNFINDIVFSCPLGKVCTPKKIKDHFLLVKPIYEFQSKILSKSNFDENKTSIKKQYLKREKTILLKKFVARTFNKKPYNLNKGVFTKVTHLLDSDLFNSKDKKVTNWGDLTTEAFQQETIWRKQVVSFSNGKTWSVKKLFERLSVSPYRVSLKSPKEFRYSIIKATRRMLDDEMLYFEALKKKLNKTPYMMAQNSMWTDYYKSEALLRSDKKSKQHWSKVLDSLKADIDIKVNWSILDTLNINPTRMMVLKKHFPGRTIVPPLRSWWINIKHD